MTLAQTASGTILVGIRLGGLFVFAPCFSSMAIPAKVKATLLVTMTLIMGPILASHSGTDPSLGVLPVARELAISLSFGLALSLVLELANTAGQIAGLQMSFTLVNLLDPSSNIETSLFSQMFQLMTTTLLISTGADRAILRSLLRTFTTVPLGGTALRADSILFLIPLIGGIVLAAFQLAAPLIAATVLVEISIVALSRLSPHLPVMALTVPAKTLVGYAVLIVSLSAWTMFIESRFSSLLDTAQTAVVRLFG